MTTSPFDLTRLELPAIDEPVDLDLQVLRFRRELAAACSDAEAALVDDPTAYVARIDTFAGLAFARALGGRSPALREGDSGGHFVGCASRGVVVSALRAADAAASHALATLALDADAELPLVVLGRTTRLATLSRWGLLKEPARPAR